MRFGRLTRAPRRVLILFLTVTLVPLAALGWLSWRLFQLDRELESQRIHDRLEQTADQVVTALNAQLVETAERLADPDAFARDLRDDAVVIALGPGGVQSLPAGRLLYYPEAPRTEKTVPEEIFAPGDALEYQQEDYRAAIVFFRELARSSDVTTRAAALVRLASNYTKNRQPLDALATYEELEKLGSFVLSDGTPADLFARKAQCKILAGLGRTNEHLRESEALNADFESGRWMLDHGSYGLYFRDAPTWFPQAAQPGQPSPARIALAEAVKVLWDDWRQTKRLDGKPWSGVDVEGRPLLILSRLSQDTLTALVAGPDYVQGQWGRVWKNQGVTVALVGSDDRQSSGVSATRRAADTKLPWTMHVASANPAADSAQFDTRRRLLWTGLSLMALLMILGAYFTSRAAAREFAVARLQSDFVSAVSHEFRTPLTSLRHLTELLSNDVVLTDDRRRQYYTVMSQETERLHRLVEGLLAFGRMEALGSQQTFEPIDPVELTESTVKEFHPGTHRIELTTNGVRRKSLIVRANREALSRALRNLVENAVKYSPDSPVVKVHLAHDGDHVAIRVHDDGYGISTEEQKTIFDKFVRGAASKALNVPGTGIGLAMTQHIVHAHGGEILLESEVGRGTTFTIQLPVVNE